MIADYTDEDNWRRNIPVNLCPLCDPLYGCKECDFQTLNDDDEEFCHECGRDEYCKRCCPCADEEIENVA